LLPLPHTTEHALRAILQVAARHPEPLRVGEIAELIKAPANYLSKILHQLTRAGILRSTRGPRGGFRLAADPSAITLEQVASVFAHSHEHRCLIGHGACGETPGCAVHERWLPIATSIHDFFGSTTLADLEIPSSTPAPEGRIPPSRPEVWRAS
jgi:Rrf2 family protein